MPARWLWPEVGFHLHSAGRPVTRGVDHKIDPGIRGQPGTVYPELEELVLHQQLAGSADVLGVHVRRLAPHRHKSQDLGHERGRQPHPGIIDTQPPDIPSPKPDRSAKRGQTMLGEGDVVGQAVLGGG